MNLTFKRSAESDKIIVNLDAAICAQIKYHRLMDKIPEMSDPYARVMQRRDLKAVINLAYKTESFWNQKLDEYIQANPKD